jgi:phosphatidylglycerophosphate synthase
MSKKIESPKELRRICQRRPKGSGLGVAVKMAVMKRLSIYITWVLLHTPVTANQVTVSFIVIGLIGSFLLAFGNQWLSILGALVLFLHSVLDHVDGEVARYKKICSPGGKYLDLVAHKIVNPIVFACISFGVYHNCNAPMVFAFGFAAVTFRLLERDVRSIGLRALGNGQANYDTLEDMGAKKRSRFVSRIRGLGLHSFICGTLAIQAAILVGAIFNRLDIVLIFYGVVLPVFALSRVHWWFKVIKSSAPVLGGESAFGQPQQPVTDELAEQLGEAR